MRARPIIIPIAKARLRYVRIPAPSLPMCFLDSEKKYYMLITVQERAGVLNTGDLILIPDYWQGKHLVLKPLIASRINQKEQYIMLGPRSS
jgi:hypothetical protein